MPQSLRQLLLAEFNAEQAGRAPPLTAEDVYEVPGLLDRADLLSLAALDLPGAQGSAVPRRSRRRGWPQGRNIFDVIREGDLLLHHPYDSFADLGGAVPPGRRPTTPTCSPSS